MSNESAIEWTDATWNPVRGCTKVSPGCAHCYAETFAERFRDVPGHPYAQGFDLRLVPEKLDEPLRWKKPRRIFVNSMSDLFHEGVEEDYIAAVFAVMALARQHTFQVLTKRADRMRRLVIAESFRDQVDQWISLKLDDPDRPPALQWDPANRRTDDANATAPDVHDIAGWPLPNVWLGVSVENQHFADERIPLLLETPAAVRFISAEPLLGPVDLNGLPDVKGDPSWDASALHGVRECAFGATVQREPINRLDWVIVGGESGPGARPFDLAWGRSLVHQCRMASVPVFVKQLGSHPVGWWSNSLGPRVGKFKSSKGGDPSEWPEDLRVREWPR